MTVDLPAPDRVLDVDGVLLAVDDRGAGDGVPLVLVHGFTGGRVDFADVIDDLATDRRVVAYDHRGHADSANPGHGYDFATLAADLAACTELLGLGRFHLLGHSMGGIVAMRHALAHPDRVASLVLMDTLAEPSLAIPPSWVDHVVETGRDRGMAAVADLFARGVSSAPIPAKARDRVTARLRHKVSSMDVEAFRALAGELSDFPSLLGSLGSIACPATVMVGALDTSLLGQATAIASAIPGAHHVEIAGAAHSPQDERPEAWLAAVRHHLAVAEASQPRP